MTRNKKQRPRYSGAPLTKVPIISSQAQANNFFQKAQADFYLLSDVHSMKDKSEDNVTALMGSMKHAGHVGLFGLEGYGPSDDTFLKAQQQAIREGASIKAVAAALKKRYTDEGVTVETGNDIQYRQTALLIKAATKQDITVVGIDARADPRYEKEYNSLKYAQSYEYATQHPQELKLYKELINKLKAGKATSAEKKELVQLIDHWVIESDANLVVDNRNANIAAERLAEQRGKAGHTHDNMGIIMGIRHLGSRDHIQGPVLGDFLKEKGTTAQIFSAIDPELEKLFSSTLPDARIDGHALRVDVAKHPRPENGTDTTASKMSKALPVPRQDSGTGRHALLKRTSTNHVIPTADAGLIHGALDVRSPQPQRTKASIIPKYGL